jgi:hypothetical protein
MTTDLVKQELTIAEPQASNIMAAIMKVASDASVDVNKLDKLLDMQLKMMAIQAEQQFAAAFVRLQAETPNVQATKPVPNRDGTVRYKFAPFEDIMEQVGPMLQKHGFTVCFSSRFNEGRIISTCTLQHVGGHKRSNDFAVRIGAGPPGSTESQADGSAATYAKRFALTEALNIVISHLDNDAKLEGGPITKDQAFELERRVAETNSNKEAFLKFAGAKTFAEIPAVKYSILDDQLSKKERGR